MGMTMAITATAISADRSTRSRRFTSRSSSVRYGVRFGGGISARRRTRVLRTRKASHPMTATATMSSVTAPRPIRCSLVPSRIAGVPRSGGDPRPDRHLFRGRARPVRYLDARRPLWVDRGLVGGPRGLDHLAGVDDELPGVVHLDHESIEVSWSRAALVLAVVVVLGRVAGTLEALRGVALRDPAAEMHAPLPQGHEPAGDHRQPLEAASRLVALEGDQVGLGGGDEERGHPAVGEEDLGGEILRLARRDL